MLRAVAASASQAEQLKLAVALLVFQAEAFEHGSLHCVTDRGS